MCACVCVRVCVGSSDRSFNLSLCSYDSRSSSHSPSIYIYICLYISRKVFSFHSQQTTSMLTTRLMKPEDDLLEPCVRSTSNGWSCTNLVITSSHRRGTYTDGPPRSLNQLAKYRVLIWEDVARVDEGGSIFFLSWNYK